MSVKCFTIKPNNEVDKLLYNTFTTKYKPGWLEVGDLKICLPLKYKEIADDVENFKVRDDDIFVVSHPRTGTTWTQEMVWLVAKECDFEGAKTKITCRYPFLEGAAHIGDEILKKLIKRDPEMDYINYANSIKESPRFIKSHLPWDLLPKSIRNKTATPKIIYVMRNPKDACVSFYYLSKSLNEFSGTLEDFCKIFLAGRAYYGPFWSNVLSYWNRRNEPNILIVRYEDMKNNMPSVLRDVAQFLNKKLTDSQISALKNHLSFETLSRNEYVNCEKGMAYLRSLLTDDKNFENFMRKGTIGSYKEDMSPEMIKKFDAWILENTKGTGIQFI